MMSMIRPATRYQSRCLRRHHHRVFSKGWYHAWPTIFSRVFWHETNERNTHHTNDMTALPVLFAPILLQLFECRIEENLAAGKIV